MATIRKNNKKKIIIIISIVLALALIITGITLYVKDSKIPQVSLYTIGTSDIYESINSSGTVSAGAVKNYSVNSVAVVKEVFVKVGDEVKQGDILATFDTSNFDDQIKKLQETYDDAKASYNDAVASQKEAKKNLDDLNDKIAKLEKEISKLEKKIANDIEAAMPAEQPTLSVQQPTLPAELPTLPSELPTLPTVPSTNRPSTPSTTLPAAPSADNFADTVARLTDMISKLSDDPRVNGVVLGIVLDTVVDEIRNGNTDSDSVADAVEAAINKAVKDGTIDTDKLSVDLDEAIKSVREAVEGVNWSGAEQPSGSGNLSQNATGGSLSQAIADGIQSAAGGNTMPSLPEGVTIPSLPEGATLPSLPENVTIPSVDANSIVQSISESDSVKLATDQVTLSSYYAQKQLYTSLASDNLVNTRKELMETAKSALDNLKDARQQLAEGWTAAFDGVITECSIFPGEQTSLLSNGITLQNMDTMVVTISLGEYDIHKVKVDMPVTVSSAYGTYSGKVISKAPVAGGGSSGGSSIVDSIGSMMGISGLSSLTDTGSGVEVKISVDDPDENIIVGFNAAVEIHIGEFLGVPTVPAESMLHDKTGTYVYLYNEEDGTVSKTQITTGAMSYTEYEITSGIKQGDRIVHAPQASFEDTFEVKIAAK